MAEIALSLVTWPGRDRLRHLAPLSSITQLASLLADELEESVSPDAPLLLAGHSMGAQVAFETCRLLEQRGFPARADYFRLPCPSSAFPAQAQRPR
jgi:thioesterase component of yersiniabactin synthetase